MNDSRGFSLIEVMVALAIVSIGALGMISLQASSISYTRNAQIRSQAVTMGHAIIEAMRANRDAAQAGDYNLAIDAKGQGTCADSNTLTAQDIGCWRAMLGGDLPAGRGSVSVVPADSSDTFAGPIGASALQAYIATVVVTWGQPCQGEGCSRRVIIETEL